MLLKEVLMQLIRSLLILLAFATGASAEPPIPNVNFQTTFNPTTRRITVVDANNNNFAVLSPGGPVWEPESPGFVCVPNLPPLGDCPPDNWVYNCADPTSGCPTPDPDRISIAPTITAEPRTDGCDLVFTFTNTSPTRRASLGVINVPGIRFGNIIKSRDFFVDGKPITLDATDFVYAGNWVYPGGTYAPVIVMDEDTPNGYQLGVSLQYPILEYKHPIWMNIIRYRGTSDWFIRIELNPWCGGGTQHNVHTDAGDLQPGETRTYRLTLRLTRTQTIGTLRPTHWLRLFESYREFFNCTYGYTEYARDPRPMYGAFIAIRNSAANCTPANTHAWHELNIPGIGPLRPDIHGWAPWIQYLGQLRQIGAQRIMLWAPSGMYCTHPCDNFPFQFTSHWADLPAIRDSMDIFREYTNALGGEGDEVGLWWGNCVNASTSWDAHDLTTIIPDDANPADDNLALAELDLAANSGAQVVGLDAFIVLPQWQGYHWLKRLQQRHPGTRFCTEAMASDFLHTLAPSYMLGTRNAGNQGLKVTNPHHLADFLNPGHEIWAQINIQDIAAELGHPPTEDEIRTVLRRYADLGYVPHLMAATGLGPPSEWSRYNASRSWKVNVPANVAPCPADINRCGGVSVQDLFDFLTLYFAGSWKADFNTSDQLSVQDLFDFLAAYFAPC